MPVQAEPPSGQRALADGLRRLAALVNDALDGLVARPMLAGASGWDTLAGGDGFVMHTVETPLPAHRVPLSRPRPMPSPRQDPDGTDIAADHAETWVIVERAKGGDGDAFAQLYDRYFDLVFRFIYFRVNDRALAEDFTSETFLRALRRIGTINYQGRDIGAWFITIARNIVLDHVKSARNRLEITTADTIEGDERAESTENAVLEVLTAERLMQAVRQLGDEQRECVMLRFVQGFSVAETAQAMGKNDGAIKALQHRAVRKLADLIGGDLS